MYADKAEMLKRYREDDLIALTDRAEPFTGAIVDAVLEAALEDAAALIDTYISKRYNLPVASVPGALKVQACAIAYYTLHQGRYPEETRKAYEDALSFLQKVADGKVHLDVGGSQPKSAPADARVDGPDQTFNRDTLKGF